MGSEINCSMKLGRKVFNGKAILETNELIFRGDNRLRIPIKEINSVSTKYGELRILFRGQSAFFQLGDKAETWMKKILHPKSVLDKLGVKPDSKVSVVGVTDKNFLKELGKRAPDVSLRKLQAESDLIFFAADAEEELTAIGKLKKSLKNNGALWIVSQKGRQATVKDTQVMAAGKKAGLVDIKVVGFSETHTALKFVVPVRER